MSFLHIAGFDFHGDDPADFDRYDSTSSVIWSSTLGKFGAGALRPLTGTANVFLTVTDSVQLEGWATFYFQRRLDSGVNAEFIVICDTAGFPHFWLEVGNSDRKSGPTDHQIILLNEDDTLLGTSINTFTGGASQPGPWVHLELWWKLGQGGGEFKLWANATLEIDVTGLTMGNTSNQDDWRLWRQEGAQGFLAGGDSHLVDDLVIQDVNGAQLAPGHRVWTSLADSDSSTEFTPQSGGDNFAMVDDIDPDQDVTYVESTGVDDRDIYGQTPPSLSGSVQAVVVKTLARRVTGSGDIKLGVKLGGSELLSAAISPDSTLWKEQQVVFVTKPGGGSWSIADVGSAEIIIEATTADVRVTQAWLEILTISINPPGTPVITIGNVDEEEVALTSDAFVVGDPGTHESSQWQVAITADVTFTSPVFDSGADLTNLLSIIATGLTHNTGYIARVRYTDSNGVSSAYSSAEGFTTDTKLGTPVITIAGTTFDTVSVIGDTFVPGDDGDPHEQSNWQLTLSTDPSFATPIFDVTTDDPFKLLAFAFAGLDLFLNSYLVRVRYRDDTVWSDWSTSEATSAIAAGQYYTAYPEPDLGDDMNDRVEIDWDEIWTVDRSTWEVVTDLTATCEILVERVQETGGASAVDPIFFQAFTPVDKQIVLARFKFDEIGTGSVTCLSGVTSPLGKICRISTGFVRRDQFDDLSEWVVVRSGKGGLGGWSLALDRGHVDTESTEHTGNNALAYSYVESTGPNSLIVWETAGSQPVGYWYQVAVKVADVKEINGQAMWWRTGWPGLAFNIDVGNNAHYSSQNAHNCGLFATWVFQVFYRHFGGGFALLDTFDATGRFFGARLSYNIGNGGYEYMKVGWQSERQDSHMAFSTMRGLQEFEHRVSLDIAHESGKVGLVVNGCMPVGGNFGSGEGATILFDSAVICSGNEVETQLVPEDWTVEIGHDSITPPFDLDDAEGIGVDVPIFNDFAGRAWPATDITVRDAANDIVEVWAVPVTADAPVGIWGGDVFQLNLGGIGVGPIAGAAVRLSTDGGDPPPDAPSGLMVTITGPDTATLDWTDNSSNETTFRIERRIGAGSWAEVDSVGANVETYLDTGLTSDTQYGWRVRARNDGGDSAYTTEATGTTQYAPPTANLMLDANPDVIPDADAATITDWPNWDANNDFLDVIGTPTVHDGVHADHRIMRTADGDHYVRWTADSSHSTAASVYTVAEITGSPGDVTLGVCGLFQSASERNGFFYRHTSTHVQGFWNNETSWLHAASGTPGISDDILYARGWTVETNGKTEVNLRYYSEDGGTPIEEIENSQPDNGMEEFNLYTVGRTGSGTSNFEGDIYRVLVYDVVHTPSEAAAIVAGLRGLYGTT